MSNDASERAMRAVAALLDRERAALLAGDLGAVAAIAEDKEALLARLVPAAEADPALLGTLREKAAGNQELLDAALHGIRALVADDNATNRLILRAMLAGFGAEVTLVEDGTEFLTVARGGAFDVYLLDISMPETDGLTALRLIRADKGAATPPAIAVTAHAMTHQIREYFDAGFDGYVAKPFRREVLGAEVARVLRISGPIAAPARVAKN